MKRVAISIALMGACLVPNIGQAQTADRGFCTIVGQSRLEDFEFRLGMFYSYQEFQNEIIAQNFRDYPHYSTWAQTRGFTIGLLDLAIGLSSHSRTDATVFKKELQSFQTRTASEFQISMLDNTRKQILTSVLRDINFRCLRSLERAELARAGIFLKARPTDESLTTFMVIMTRRDEAEIETVISNVAPDDVKCVFDSTKRPLRSGQSFKAKTVLLECKRASADKTLFFTISTNLGQPEQPVKLIGKEEIVRAEKDADLQVLRAQITTLSAQLRDLTAAVSAMRNDFATLRGQISSLPQGLPTSGDIPGLTTLKRTLEFKTGSTGAASCDQVCKSSYQNWQGACVGGGVFWDGTQHDTSINPARNRLYESIDCKTIPGGNPQLTHVVCLCLRHN
jgi:hypothetical protein